jgi:F-type H+-transporting ATPase subunit b
MEQLIEAFGIDARLIVIQIINFVVLMALLSYFLYKPVLKLLKDREERIAQGIKDAEAAAVMKSEGEAAKQALLREAHTEAEAIAKRAESYATEAQRTSRAAAEADAQRVLKEAEKQAEELKRKAEKESEAQIASLAILAAEKVLRDKTS